MQGLKAGLKTEAALREELLALCVLIPIIFILDISAVERATLLIVSVLVVIVELLNSAIEASVDRVGTEFNELAGKAKDIGSAAVFVSILLAVSTWTIILW